MEPRSLTSGLLLTLFFPLLLSAAVSSSSSAPLRSPSPLSPDSFASLPLPPRVHSPPLPPRVPFHRRSPRGKTSPPPTSPSRPFGHPDRHQPQRSVARKSPSKPELNFGEKLGLLFIGVAAALQVLLGTFLVYKRIQLKKVERREQRHMASSSGPST